MFVNMTHHGPILEENGDIDFSKNLESLLAEIFSKKKPFPKKKKVTVLVSKVIGPEDFPQRVEVEKVYSFGYLCQLYRKWLKKDFDLNRYKKEEQYKWKDYEREFRQRSAWGQYVQIMHILKLEDQERRVASLPREQQEAKRKEFEKRNGLEMLYIG